EEDYSVSVHLAGRDRQALGQVDGYPGGGSYPTRQWLPGQVIQDTHHIPVRPDADAPVAARVEVAVYRYETREALPAMDGQGQGLNPVVTGRVKVIQDMSPLGPPTTAEPVQPLDANLDNRVRLAGYTLGSLHAEPEGTIPVSLYWQVVGALDGDYVVFLHLVDVEGHIVGQGDGPPLGGDYPTSFWESGEVLLDTHLLQVHEVSLSGPLRIFVGLYDRDTERRLPVLDAQGAVVGDAVLIATLPGQNE
ncbi:MAG: hypothetical protein ACYC5M_16765, partial [Anaerolineae bacterium]